MNLSSQSHERGWHLTYLASKLHERGWHLKKLISKLHERDWNFKNLASKLHERGWNLKKLPSKLHERGWILKNLPSKLHERCAHSQKKVLTLLGVFDNDLAKVSVFAIVNFGFWRTSAADCSKRPPYTETINPFWAQYFTVRMRIYTREAGGGKGKEVSSGCR